MIVFIVVVVVEVVVVGSDVVVLSNGVVAAFRLYCDYCVDECGRVKARPMSLGFMPVRSSSTITYITNNYRHFLYFYQ